MNQNREIASFPFKPHLAKYLFYSIKGEVVETEEARFKYLDVDLNSPDGKIIRLLFKRADYPNIDSVKKGFRLTVEVPKLSDKKFDKYIESSRYGSISIDEECAFLINELYEARFRDHFHTFVCGYIAGAEGKRGSFKKALNQFCEIYDLFDKDEFDPAKYIKFYQRTDSPVKTGIYDKPKVQSAVEVK